MYAVHTWQDHRAPPNANYTAHSYSQFSSRVASNATPALPLSSIHARLITSHTCSNLMHARVPHKPIRGQPRMAAKSLTIRPPDSAPSADVVCALRSCVESNVSRLASARAPTSGSASHADGWLCANPPCAVQRTVLGCRHVADQTLLAQNAIASAEFRLVRRKHSVCAA